jgi:endonuclease/exonuclease/phosphatase family metal-dependent hydrolase
VRRTLPLLFLVAGACAPVEEMEPLELVAVTFNTGTSEGSVPASGDNGGYTEVQAGYSDLHYGDGLAFRAVMDDTRAFFDEVQPDIVGFQEIFHAGECDLVPEEARAGFVCETWQPGDPTVAQQILGDGYQVACHLEKTDKCLAVRRALGTIRGCDDDLCLDGLDGARVETCGQGSRVGRAIVDLVGGGELTVVNVHGSSGLADDDMGCRKLQFEQVFEDIGDGSGEPAANGERNLILGDFNTDPGRFYDGDVSADELLEHVGRDKDFHFLTDVGEDAEPTYASIINIDHVISDTFTGECWHAGITEGHPEVTDIHFFDHKPAVCALTAP